MPTCLPPTTEAPTNEAPTNEAPTNEAPTIDAVRPTDDGPSIDAASLTDAAPPIDRSLPSEPGGRFRRPSRQLLASGSTTDLAIAAKDGDAAAAGELYRRLQGRARHVARRFCLDLDADDAVAEGLSRALRRVDQLQDPAAVEAWLIRSVVRVAVDLSRQRARRGLIDAAHAFGDDASHGSESAAERAMAALDRDAMARAVHHLEPGQQLLLYLRYEAGLSVQHIALALGKPAGTIRRQCVEARRRAGQQFLWCHLRPAEGACAEVTVLICREPYRRSAPRVRQRATEHLRRCRTCRDRQAELADLLTELGCRSSPRHGQPRSAPSSPRPAPLEAGGRFP